MAEAQTPASLALLADLEKAGAIDITGLRLPANATYEQFEGVCLLLGKMHEAVRFAIGDAIRQGELLFGEDAYQAIELIGLSEKGKLEYVRVSAKVPRSVRRKDLSWSHHRAVAALPVPEQREWLARSVDEQLSHHELRDALRMGTQNGQPERTCDCCGQPL